MIFPWLKEVMGLLANHEENVNQTDSNIYATLAKEGMPEINGYYFLLTYFR